MGTGLPEPKDAHKMAAVLKPITIVVMKKLTLTALLGAMTLTLTACCDKDEAQTAQTSQPASQEKAIPVSEKKANFWALMEPLIEQTNSEVLAERETVKTLQLDASALNASQQATLAKLNKKYRVSSDLSAAEQIQQLLIKVDTVPASLVLAQAANESAWGQSRFATEGNNYFGQWCFSKGCGLVPKSRNAGASHEVAKFDSPLDSVRSYIRNLNSHPTYEKLRQLRSASLQKGELPSGELLAEGLIGYSERGEEYIKEIQSMIRFNKLSRFDQPQNSQKSQG